MRLIALILISSFVIMQACTEEGPAADSKKITYRVSGTDFNMMYRDEDGHNKTIYNLDDVKKIFRHASPGEPLYLLAWGSDDIVLTIRVEDEFDTLVRAKSGGTPLVFIDMTVK